MGDLATHIGKGLTFTEFAEVVGAPIDAGYLFGGGSLEFWEPIRLGTRYRVCGGIVRRSLGWDAEPGRST